MPTKVRSHAKINLGLGIGAPRADGFHALATVYQTLELHDVVTVTAQTAAATAIQISCNDARVPTDDRNTAWKMVELALKMYGRAAEVQIHIEKRLPVQGGLGAGSANAVAALVGLEAELGAIGKQSALLPQVSETRSPPHRRRPVAGDPGPGAPRNSDNPPFRDKTAEGWGTPELVRQLSGRLEIAAQVGSDVPLFLIGGTVLGLDRGQEVYPLPDVEPTWCVVATPDLGVSTAQAFRDWDAICTAEGLTQDASAGKLNELSRAYASAFAGGIPQVRQGACSSGVLSGGEDLAGPLESALVRTGISSWIQNDFERVVFPQQPSLAEIKRLLAGTGTPGAALHASLSGSGSALFGLYLTQGDAEAACERLRLAAVKSYLTRTLPRADYWRNMLSR